MTAAFALPARLDLSTAPQLARDLLARPADQDLVLDASAVSHLGTLGVQVLIAATRRAQAAGAQIHITDLPARAQTQLEALGLTLHSLTEAST